MVQSFNIHHPTKETKRTPDQNEMATTLSPVDHRRRICWFILQTWFVDWFQGTPSDAGASRMQYLIKPMHL
jgi:hypothetical protein